LAADLLDSGSSVAWTHPRLNEWLPRNALSLAGNLRILIGKFSSTPVAPAFAGIRVGSIETAQTQNKVNQLFLESRFDVRKRAESGRLKTGGRELIAVYGEKAGR
jgi:hypothetical protein